MVYNGIYSDEVEPKRQAMEKMLTWQSRYTIVLSILRYWPKTRSHQVPFLINAMVNALFNGQNEQLYGHNAQSSLKIWSWHSIGMATVCDNVYAIRMVLNHI